VSELDSPKPEAAETAPSADAATTTTHTIKKAAARATAASMRLENREVPASHIRFDGVSALLAEREARKH
jgi:hypothetical protein